MLHYVKNLRRLRRILWGIVLVLLLAIFLFSAQSGDQSGDTSTKITRFIMRLFHADFADMPDKEQVALLEKWNFLIRKCAHFTEYAVLAFAFCLLLHTYPLKKRALLAWIGATAYAATDEIHQLSVAERTGSVWDVLLDSGGALFGIIAAVFLIRRWRRKRAANTEGKP